MVSPWESWDFDQEKHSNSAIYPEQKNNHKHYKQNLINFRVNFPKNINWTQKSLINMMNTDLINFRVNFKKKT